MYDLSPVSSSIGFSPDQNQNFRQDQSSGSIAPSLDSLKKKSPLIRVLHPNAPIPGRWWGNTSTIPKYTKDKKSFVANGNLSSTHLDEESSMDEFFETTDRFVQFQQSEHFNDYSPLSSALEDFDPKIKPHMTEPLLPDGSPLNFSPIKQYRGETNIFSATPLARVWEFNSGTDKHEYSILNILADEFENLDEEKTDSKQGFWSQFRKFTVGLNEDEYDNHYPWAKYCIRSLSESNESNSDSELNHS